MREYSINVEEYEKLKAKVADNEVYITELLEEKAQQKQIITGYSVLSVHDIR